MRAEVKRGWTIEEHGKWTVLVLNGYMYARCITERFTLYARNAWRSHMHLAGEPELILKKGEVALLPAEQRKSTWD